MILPKENLLATAVSTVGEILIEPLIITNNHDGFYLLLSKLAPLDWNSIIIGFESTAHYGNNLVHFLISKDFYSVPKEIPIPNALASIYDLSYSYP